MPQKDGTGPCGMGPGTGRGWGRMNRFAFLLNKPGRRKFGLYAAAVPLVGVIIKDLQNPDGIVRLLAGKLFGFRRSLPADKRVDACYTVVDNDSMKKSTDKKI